MLAQALGLGVISRLDVGVGHEGDVPGQCRLRWEACEQRFNGGIGFWLVARADIQDGKLPYGGKGIGATLLDDVQIYFLGLFVLLQAEKFVRIFELARRFFRSICHVYTDNGAYRYQHQ